MKYLLVLFLLCPFSFLAQITITGYDHEALSVADINVSTAFYRDVLGLEPIPVPEHLKEIRSWFTFGDGRDLHLLAGRTEPTTNYSREGSHFAINIPDADPVEDFLKMKNIAYHRQQRFDGAWQIYISDPDGYVIELNEPPASPNFVSRSYHLWQDGAPGFEDKKEEPEQAKDYWVKNVHNPSLVAYFPEETKANGAAVIICPGGGHEKLVINSEGHATAKYFANLGFTAFVLKYRLFREPSSPYTERHALQDGQRAMRLVRSKAEEWRLDPARIGVMGFSAGGELAAWVSFAEGDGDKNSSDPIEHFSSRPDFQILVYPGPLAVTESIGNTAPPAFFVAANDDECCSDPILQLALMYRKADVPVELHLFSQGNHAFNMGTRSMLKSIHTWPGRLEDWLLDNGLVTE